MTHRNADTRIREAFDTLRAELRDVLGPVPPPEPRNPYEYADLLLEVAEKKALDFAKLPADA